MILDSLKVPVDDFEARSGWRLDDRGACKGEVCFPIAPETRADGIVDVLMLSDQLNMPIVHDEKHDLWSLGPIAGGRALISAVAPRLVLPDVDGKPFELESLLGRKVLLVAWASW